MGLCPDLYETFDFSDALLTTNQVTNADFCTHASMNQACLENHHSLVQHFLESLEFTIDREQAVSQARLFLMLL